MDNKDQSIKILLVEDLPTDAELAQRELKKENINFNSKVVDTEEEFVSQLQEYNPDIIISDYSMPYFDGMSALKIAQSFNNYLPFIILTGSMNEETAVACMKAGADDYVLKEKITRLPFAVTEAIKKNKNRIEKEKMQRQIKNSLEEYQDLLNNMNETIWIIHPNGTLLDVNDTAVNKLGYSKEELLKIGITGIDYYLRNDKIKDMIYSMPVDKTQVFETWHKTKSGRQIPVEISSTIIHYKGEQAILSVARDITERIKAEKTQKFLYKIASKSLVVKDLKSYFQYIHKELQQIIKADNFSIILYDKHTDKYSIPFFIDEYDNLNSYKPITLKNTLTDYIRRTGKPQLITPEKEKELSEKENIRVYGTPSPVWVGAPIIDTSKDEVIGVIVLQDYHDSTAYNYDDLNTLKIIAANIGMFIDRVKNLEQLHLMSKAIEQNPTSITITDAEGKIQYVNSSFSQITGYPPDQVVGKDTTFLRSGVHSEDFYQNMQETLYSGKDWIGEFNNKRANGEYYWEEAIISPIVNENGETTHFIKVAEDITEKKKMHEELKSAKEKAEESDRLKSAFLANISHEIRTPMNGVLGFINLLNEPDLDESSRNEYIQIVNKSGERLLETINNIIEVSKIEAGESGVSFENVKLNDITNYLYDFFKLQADKKKIALKIGKQVTGSKALIRTDKQKVEGILSNLLKNAIKFTHKGFIEFGNYIEDDFLVFYVKDTGIGIPQDKQDMIFDRFGQVNIELTRDHEGSGIGLSIVKSHTANLGGHVWFDSELNKGSIFYFSIPYFPVLSEKTDKTSSTKESMNTKKLEGQTILIAEDNPSSYKLLEIMLAKENVNIINSISGTETIEKLKQNPTISLILMDIKMPDMDGFEATREIRKFNETIPIIGQSAYALKGDREKAIEAGCNDYITKPINKQTLLKLVNKYIE